MIKVTIKPGDTFRDIVTLQAKLQVNWHSSDELALLVQHCVVSGQTQLPNIMFPGDTIELPTKSEWKRIKSGETL